MSEKLKAFINNYVQLSADEWQAVLPFVQKRKLKKGEIFIAENSVPDEIAFTLSGYMRVYFNHEGNEITRDITPLNSFATALPAFIHQKPSYEIISAITDCDLLVIKKKDLEYLYDNFPKWERFGRRIVEDMFVQAQYRLYMFITKTAEERYLYLMKNNPDIVLNVPMQYIASFLGITKQSLSRLRKGI